MKQNGGSSSSAYRNVCSHRRKVCNFDPLRFSLTHYHVSITLRRAHIMLTDLVGGYKVKLLFSIDVPMQIDNSERATIIFGLCT